MKTRLFTFVFISLFCTSLFAQLPEHYSTELVQSSYSQPMGTLFNADGTKMFVWTYAGKIFVSNWDGTQYVKQTDPVLDISEEVGAWRDFGLLSIALDPNFDTNGLVYLFYVVDRHYLFNYGTSNYNANTNTYYQASISRITRYQLNISQQPMTTDYSSRFVLLGETKETGIPLLYESHAGGCMVFGTDGTLMVTTGDNASYNTTDTGSVSQTYYQQAINDGILRPEENVGALRSQMPTSLCGKILRLDPATGNGVSSNPFYDSNNPRSPLSRLWAMGFRNPFRMCIKPNSGSTNPADANPGMLFVVDVGWNTWEDLHIIDKPALNAGWPLYEGQSKVNSYYNSGTTNPEEGNQLFKNLCVQPTSFADNSNLVDRRHTHSRPAVTWRHGTNDARVPWFSGTTPTDPKVGASGSPTSGILFKGNTGVSGVFITGTAFGASMQNKYLFTDYAANWINIGALNASNTPWLSDVSAFAPANFGSGIVHMIQDPLDGSVYYTNIFDGTIRRLSFYDETLNTNLLDVNAIRFYPNPTKDQLHISGISNNFQLDVFNISGQLLISKILNGDVDVPLSLSSGLYLAKVELESGQSVVRKIIIE